MSLVDWVALMALFWAIAGVFFTSLLANPVAGLVTGIAGSLGYWLTQHDVERGSQPWFYYFVIGALYEFLPMLLGATATIAAMLRLRDPQDDPEAELAGFVRRMAGGGRFDFDVVGYRVYDATYAASGAYGGGYDPYTDCLACGYPIGSSVNIRIGGGRLPPWPRHGASSPQRIS